MAVFGSSLGEAEGFVNGFLCEMVLIIGPRGSIFPLKSTHCLTHTSDCWLPLWSHWEELPALQWGVGVLGECVLLQEDFSGKRAVSLPAMKANPLFSDQQLLFVKNGSFLCQAFLMLPGSVRTLGLYKSGTILCLSFIV